MLRFRYQTIEFGDTDIHVKTLRDNQQFLDEDDIALKLGISSATWPLFGVIWASGEILAHLMHDYDIQNQRILEVGCGIGLASLVLNERLADITATDYHPEVASLLLENTDINNKKAIPFLRTHWDNTDTQLGKFDTIIGSDLLYERGHADLLAHFIDRHTKPQCKIIIIDPGRKHHTHFSKTMLSLGYTCEQIKPDNVDYLIKKHVGAIRFQILTYQRQASVVSEITS